MRVSYSVLAGVVQKDMRTIARLKIRLLIMKEVLEVKHHTEIYNNSFTKD